MKKYLFNIPYIGTFIFWFKLNLIKIGFILILLTAVLKVLL
jgi:hypothetical protein